jgi:hypothetical protein
MVAQILNYKLPNGLAIAAILDQRDVLQGGDPDFPEGCRALHCLVWRAAPKASAMPKAQGRCGGALP